MVYLIPPPPPPHPPCRKEVCSDRIQEGMPLGGIRFRAANTLLPPSHRPPHPFEDKMRSIQFASPPALRRQWRHGRTRSSERPAAKNITTCTAPTAVSGEPYLPPLVRLQGPFKPPEEVRRLKSKPPKPTLRVATSYDSEKLRRQVGCSKGL